MRPTPYTLHPTAFTLHPTPYTLHPTPYTLHPTLHTLHLTPSHTPLCRYDLSVDAKGSTYEDRYPDGIFKIMYDVETEVPPPHPATEFR